MALHLQKQTTRGGAWVTVNIITERISDFKLTRSEASPTQLTFTIHQAHHTLPIGKLEGIRFWDDEPLDVHSNPIFSESSPTFLGQVEQVTPGEDGHSIHYVCLDPTTRVGSETKIMSFTWTNATTPATGAVPRLIFNASIDNDDDWAFCRAFDKTVGEIIKTVLDDCLARLRVFNAAPAASAAYVQADLDAMDYVPQEKIVFDSEPIRAGITRLLEEWEPEYRLWFNPATREWRFYKLTAATIETRTLNEFDAAFPILSLEVERSIEGCYTAVKFYGPEQVEQEIATTGDSSLTVLETTPMLRYVGDPNPVQLPYRWQIANANKRRIGRLLPKPIQANVYQFQVEGTTFWSPHHVTRQPQLQAKWQTNKAGDSRWMTLTGWTIRDPSTGIVEFRSNQVTDAQGGLYRYNRDPPSSAFDVGGNYGLEPPEEVRLIYPNYVDPLSVRYPAVEAVDQFAGTAYDDHGLANEKSIYNEMLAVGWLHGIPVTTEERIEKFAVIAEKAHAALGDTRHVGSFTLLGLDYDWHSSIHRVSFDGVDGAGAPKTTNMENIAAWVTDVEYDYEEGVTTVSLHSDQAELLGYDVDAMIQRTKFRAYQIIEHLWTRLSFSYVQGRTPWGTSYLAQLIHMQSGIERFAFDPHTKKRSTLLASLGGRQKRVPSISPPEER